MPSLDWSLMKLVPFKSRVSDKFTINVATVPSALSNYYIPNDDIYASHAKQTAYFLHKDVENY